MILKTIFSRTLQATMELWQRGTTGLPLVEDHNSNSEPQGNSVGGHSSTTAQADRLVTSAGPRDEGLRLLSLQDDYTRLEEAHAQAQIRIKELERLLHRRWEHSIADQPVEAATCRGGVSSQEERSSACKLNLNKDAQGYKAMAARLAEEVVKFSADFSQADTDGNHASDRRRFIFWASNQVAPFLPMLK
eukprot:jgi/Ulvmu1/8949/UM005_0040.1